MMQSVVLPVAFCPIQPKDPVLNDSDGH